MFQYHMVMEKVSSGIFKREEKLSSFVIWFWYMIAWCIFSELCWLKKETLLRKLYMPTPPGVYLTLWTHFGIKLRMCCLVWTNQVSIISLSHCWECKEIFPTYNQVHLGRNNKEKINLSHLRLIISCGDFTVKPNILHLETLWICAAFFFFFLVLAGLILKSAALECL